MQARLVFLAIALAVVSFEMCVCAFSHSSMADHFPSSTGYFGATESMIRPMEPLQMDRPPKTDPLFPKLQDRVLQATERQHDGFLRTRDQLSNIVVGTILGPSVGMSVPSDCLILQQLQNTTFNTSFPNAACLSDCCQCTNEVVCDAQGYVTHVRVLPSTGTIPDSIMQLPRLQYLRVVDAAYGADRSDDALAIALVVDNPLPTSVGGTLPAFSQPLPPSLHTVIFYGSFVGSFPTAWFVNPGQLIRLQISASLQGTLPSTLPLQTNLQALQIQSNFLYGAVNLSVFYGMPNLRILSLQGLLSGNLGSVKPLQQLEVLDIEGSFTAIIPYGISFLQKLRYLYLSGMFRGQFPVIDLPSSLIAFELIGQYEGALPESAYDSLLNLQYLGLIGQVTGALSSRICALEHLIELAMVGQFQGLLPSCVFGFKNLTDLFIRGFFEGPLPSDISSLTQLTSLNLDAKFTGSIPQGLDKLSALTSLRIIGDFVEPINASVVVPLVNLTYLALLGNWVGPPPFLSTLTKLISLDLEGNFDGCLPTLSAMNLQVMAFKGFFDCGSADFSSFQQLSVVSMLANFSLFAPPMLPPSVSHLFICCRATITANTLAPLTRVTFLDLSGCLIESSVLDLVMFPMLQIAFLDGTGLEVLDISGPLLQLRILSAADNYISEFFSLSHAPNLNLIDLSNNQLKGPVSLFSFTCELQQSNILQQLVYLDISNNDFSTLGWLDHCPLESVFWFNVSSNNLSGQIPEALPYLLPFARSVDLSWNKFNGSLPLSIITLSNLAFFSVGNNPLIDARESISPYFIFPGQQAHLSPTVSALCPNWYLFLPQGLSAIIIDDSSTGYYACKCLRGYYGIAPNCRQCTTVSQDNNVICPGDGGLYAAQGYWATPPLDFQAARFPEYVLPCVDSGSRNSMCRYDEMDLSSGVCAEGHEGRLCAACQDGWFKVSQALCLRCTTSEAIMGVVLTIGIVVFILIATFGMARSSDSHSAPVSKVFVEFFQILYFVMVPPPNGLFFSTSASGIINLRLVGISCLVGSGFSYRAEYIAALLALPLLYVTLCFGYLISLLIVGVLASPELRLRFMYHSIWLIFFCYVGVAYTLMEPLACVEDPGLHALYMENSPAEKCDEALRAVSGLLTAVFLVGIPLSILWIVRRAYTTPGAYLPNSFAMVLNNFCTRNYASKLWFWDVLTLVRRSLLIAMFVTISTDSTARALLILLVLVGSLVLHVRCQPFRDQRLNRLQTFLWCVAILNFSVSSRFRIPGAVDTVAISWIFILLNFSCVIIAVWMSGQSLYKSLRKIRVRNNSTFELALLDKHRQSLR